MWKIKSLEPISWILPSWHTSGSKTSNTVCDSHYLDPANCSEKRHVKHSCLNLEAEQLVALSNYLTSNVQHHVHSRVRIGLLYCVHLLIHIVEFHIMSIIKKYIIIIFRFYFQSPVCRNIIWCEIIIKHLLKSKKLCF